MQNMDTTNSIVSGCDSGHFVVFIVSFMTVIITNCFIVYCRRKKKNVVNTPPQSFFCQTFKTTRPAWEGSRTPVDSSETKPSCVEHVDIFS